MLRNKNAGHDRKQGNDYWQSYSDMMAALLLMFILIMALTLARSLKMFEEKTLTIEQQQAELELQRETLESKQADLEGVKKELNNLTQMVGVKTDIIKALKKEFQSSDLEVRVDENTGAITFDSGIFFDFGSSQVSPEGKKFLLEFVPQYLSVLLGDEFYQYVSEIIIEGHTDTQGDYMYNLELSQDRAYNVAAFCLNESNLVLTTEQIDVLRTILTANGRSFSDPVYDSAGEADMTASRRVVFKFRLKDDEMRDAIRDILGET